MTDATVGGVPPRSVKFDVVVGKTMDCTFTNTKKPQIRLVKVLDSGGGFREVQSRHHADDVEGVGDGRR